MAVTEEVPARTAVVYDLTGTLLEACSCNVLCPCWIGEDPDGGKCNGLIAWHLDAGTINGVDVSGCTLAGVALIPGNVLQGGWKVAFFLNDDATDEQMQAILDAYTGKLGGPLADMAPLICVVAQLTGRARLVHHDVLIHSGLPLWIGLLAFLLAWQLMTAAMMLPSSLPMIQLFGRVSANQDRPGVVMAAFLGGYAYVWTLFGAVAFLFDLGIHRSVDSSVWLTAHQWLVPGGLLVIAGAFQFSSLKDACL